MGHAGADAQTGERTRAAAEGDGIDWDQTKTESRSQSHQKRGQSAAGSYGDAAGQIARLPEGNILSAITSPPFADVTPHQDQSFVFKRAHGVESGGTRVTLQGTGF
ncbi:MAG: hypothetical protein AAB252_05910, partial [Pseudomonadota bacterium]